MEKKKKLIIGLHQKIMESNKKTKGMIDQLSGRLHTAFVSYHVWKWMEQSRNINIGEEKAYKNLEIMNRQINFFQTTLRGAFYSFVIDLAMFFDRQTPALSIDKIIGRIELSLEAQTRIQNLRNLNQEKLLMLKNLRDKEIAHLDMDVDRTQKKNLIYAEIEELFSAVQEIFNIVTNSFNRSVWAWGPIEKEVDHDMKWLFENLEEGENKRLVEINKKWDISN